MTSHVIRTLIEPSIVSKPLFRTDIPAASKTISTFTSLVRITATSTPLTTTVTDTQTPLPTTATVSAISSASATPMAPSAQPTPTIAALTLAAVIVFALLLLFALLFFISLRIRGKCPNCPCYEDELKKWKNGELKVVTPETVQKRMRAWDLEKGPMEVQAKMYRDRMRMQSLASLEGMSEKTLSVGEESIKDGRDSTNRFSSYITDAAAQPREGDDEATLVHAPFPKTHSMYLEQVVAPREAESKRSLRETEEQIVKRYLDIASDPANRESIQQRAVIRANDYVTEWGQKGREEKEAKEKKEKEKDAVKHEVLAPREAGQSRFKERFRWIKEDRLG